LGLKKQVKRTPGSSPSSPCFTPNVLAERNDDSLHAKVQREDTRLVTIDIEASVMTTRSDIMAGLPKMNLSQPYVLHMA
jgi:hypothetical protein